MEMPENGNLIVNVTTARGAIPLAGASVTVFYGQEENGGLNSAGSIAAAVQTDSAGKTAMIPLPAPPRALSESPGNSRPFAAYTVQIEKEGYYTVTNAGVPIFSGITSIQPADLLPLAEYDPENVYPRTGLENTEGENPDL